MSAGKVTWSSSASEVATVDGSGRVVGVGQGTVDIVAAAGGKEGRTTITVVPVPVAAVVLSSTTVSVGKGQTHQLSATTRDASGAVLPGRTVTWSSSDSAKVRVSANGLITALELGTATVTAASEGKTATASVTVSAAPIPNVDRTSSYATAHANARASLIDWTKVAESGRMMTARGVADLNGDGTADAVVAPSKFLVHTATDPMRFYEGTAAGSEAISLTDRTSSWVSGAAPMVNHPRKLILGDYNEDGVKDVFVCAHGYDAAPFPGTTNVLLLSRGTTWSVAAQPWSDYVGFHHGCASADIDNDGDEDILALESNTGAYFLINDGRGTFSRSRSGLPEAIRGKAPAFTTELFDLDKDGYIDLLEGGDEKYHPTTIFWGDGSGTFSAARSTPVASVAGWQNPLVFTAGDIDGDGTTELAVTRTKGELGDADFYKGFYVQVLRLNGRGLVDITSSATAATNASAATVIRNWQGESSWIEWVWLSDFNGDGRLDLIGSDAYAGRFVASNAGGSFGAWTKLP